MRHPPSPVRSDSRLAIAATILLCAAIALAGLASPLDRVLSGVGLLNADSNPQSAAGVPGDKLYTSLLCLCSLIAGVCVALDRKAAKKAALKSSQSAPCERLTVGSIWALPGVALVSLAVRWLVLDHARAEYLDAMLRGLTYWAALASLCLSVAALGSRSAKLLQAMTTTLIASSTAAAAIGVQDYLVNIVARHIAGWREFGTSTPDFYAAFLLVTAPLCFGAFLRSSKSAGTLAYGFCAALQLGAILTTGSRFALVSILVEFAVFAAGCILLKRGGRAMPEDARGKLIVVAVLAILGGAVFAGPVLHRLQASSLHSDANSGAFRVYTWRGALALAKAYPLTGTGPNLFVYDFPRYAVAGFTRLAHSGYLQFLDELGPLGILSIILIGGGSLVFAGTALAARGHGSAIYDAAHTAATSEASDDAGGGALLLAGLASGIAGMMAQNLIDSDWMVTICGATWFAAVGLAMGSASRLGAGEPPEGENNGRSTPRGARPLMWGVAAGALILAVCCVKWTVGGWDERQENLGAAYAVVPLDGEYAGAAGYALAQDPNQFAEALALLQTAARLTPSATAYRRLAMVQLASGNSSAAMEDLRQGLKFDPHDLALLLLAAQVSDAAGDHGAAASCYREMANLQAAPYGTVPAIGNLVETRYAYADYALGRDAFQSGDAPDTIAFCLRAKAVLDEYLAEGGAANLMRAAMSSQATQQGDPHLQNLYSQTMALLASAYDRAGQAARASSIRAEAARKTPRFMPKAPAPIR